MNNPTMLNLKVTINKPSPAKKLLPKPRKKKVRLDVSYDKVESYIRLKLAAPEFTDYKLGNVYISDYSSSRRTIFERVIELVKIINEELPGKETLSIVCRKSDSGGRKYDYTIIGKVISLNLEYIHEETNEEELEYDRSLEKPK